MITNTNAIRTSGHQDRFSINDHKKQRHQQQFDKIDMNSTSDQYGKDQIYD